jgi:hypothetical protein
MARLRRMYARLLFVVVGIFRAFSHEARLFKRSTVWDLIRGGYRLRRVGANPELFWPVLALSAPLFWVCALAAPGAADIRWRHE